MCKSLYLQVVNVLQKFTFAAGKGFLLLLKVLQMLVYLIYSISNQAGQRKQGNVSLHSFFSIPKGQIVWSAKFLCLRSAQ